MAERVLRTERREGLERTKALLLLLDELDCIKARRSRAWLGVSNAGELAREAAGDASAGAERLSTLRWRARRSASVTLADLSSASDCEREASGEAAWSAEPSRAG